MPGSIHVRGAREHNLKNVDVVIPRDSLTVLTGLSGSGKSSLAFDTIYAEGQRRYVESLSAYARQFLEMMQKPDVDQIDVLEIVLARAENGNRARSGAGGLLALGPDHFIHVGIPSTLIAPHWGAILPSTVEETTPVANLGT